jgi:hypothetical protein
MGSECGLAERAYVECLRVHLKSIRKVKHKY